MIERYTLPEMARIWSEEERFAIWLKVEEEVLAEWVEKGKVPAEAVTAYRERAGFDVERIKEHEKVVKHDVIAFLTSVAEHVGEASRYVHFGMTSNDLLDTAFAIQLTRAGDRIDERCRALAKVIRDRAEEHRKTPCVGRTHGMHAEPMTFGLKLLSWGTELARQRRRLEAARSDVAVGKLGGAVGTYTELPPDLEGAVLRRLKLGVEPIPTQVVSRDRHAAFFNALAQLATSIERWCIEIRHLQRSEVGEAEEEFTVGQKGSSAMPHKRNPILSENLCGLARLVRGYAQVSLENVPLWHERDISHSSAERVIAPDACIVIDFMLHRFTGIVKNLRVYPDRMRENLERSRGLVYSGALLLALVESGLSREDAYALVQEHAMRVVGGTAEGLRASIASDERVTKRVAPETLGTIFGGGGEQRFVDALFERAANEMRDALA